MKKQDVVANGISSENRRNEWYSTKRDIVLLFNPYGPWPVITPPPR